MIDFTEGHRLRSRDAGCPDLSGFLDQTGLAHRNEIAAYNTEHAQEIQAQLLSVLQARTVPQSAVNIELPARSSRARKWIMKAGGKQGKEEDDDEVDTGEASVGNGRTVPEVAEAGEYRYNWTVRV